MDNESFSLRRPVNQLSRRGEPPYDWIGGCVLTAFGIVAVYSEAAHTRMDYACRGRQHLRTIHKGYNRRGLVTLANRFAKEISNG